MNGIGATLERLSPRELSAALRSFYAASAHRDILAGVDTSLVLFEQQLINTATGEYRPLPTDEGLSRPARLAQAAAALLRGRESQPSILLLLPTTDFVATRFSMGLSGEKLIRSALKLQAHTLIPAYEEELLLGVHGGSGEGVALWYPAARAEALFEAFAQQELFLAALMPRTLALAGTVANEVPSLLVDEDAEHLTQVDYRNGAVASLLSIGRPDLQEPAFAAQWQAESARLQASRKVHSQGEEFWTSLRSRVPGQEAYCYFPAGAERFGRELAQRKQKTVAAIAAAVLCVALLLPFVGNWIRLMSLEGEAEALRAASLDARQAQAAVFQMEEEWGVIAEFPRQDVAQVLLALNEVIDSSLSSFTLSKGVVDISGFAQDPALLIEQLAEREAFFNVGQSRSSSGTNSGERGDRFGIRFNLSGVDFPAYEALYPATQP